MEKLKFKLNIRQFYHYLFKKESGYRTKNLKLLMEESVQASTSLCIVGPSQFGFNLCMFELKMYCYKPESLKLQLKL